jgi:hypothetical protein
MQVPESGARWVHVILGVAVARLRYGLKYRDYGDAGKRQAPSHIACLT